MDFNKTSKELLAFLDSSPSPFHAVDTMAKELENAGFTRLYEGCPWTVEKGKSYFVTRNGSALIAFRMPQEDYKGFQMMASHSDSPVLKVKPNAEISVEDNYVKLNVEKYGGMILSPWLDRPLSVAGRVVVRTDKGIETRLVNIDRDLMVIPNVAIHMNRELNDGFKYNLQKDMLPLFCEKGQEEHAFAQLVAGEAGVSEEDVLDTELSLYSRVKGTHFGLNNEFIGSARIDDLECAFCSMKGIIAAQPKASVAVHAVFDNEEVGSRTKQGAGSTFLADTLCRISAATGKSREEYLMSLASSFLVSADNAHAAHINHQEMADPVNKPVMNKGIVIKYAANQKYTTDAVSGAVMRAICKAAEVPFQVFTNRSDAPGGSTLGNISQAQVAVNTVDIGLPQLSMHSCFETAGVKDAAYLAEAARVLFSSTFEGKGDGSYELKF